MKWLWIICLACSIGCKTRGNGVSEVLAESTGSGTTSRNELAEKCSSFSNLSLEEQRSLTDITTNARALLNARLPNETIPNLHDRTPRNCDILGKTIPLFDSYVLDCREADVERPLLLLKDIARIDVVDGGRCRGLARLAALPRLTRLMFYPNGKVPLIATYKRTYHPPVEPLRQVLPFSDVAQIKQLEVVDAVGCAGDVDALAGLTYVERLWLRDCQLESIAFVSHMIRLKELVLSGNDIGDLWPLMGLGSLRKLKLDGNRRIRELSPIGLLEGLEEIWLQDNLIKDIGPLAGLTHLRKALLSTNPIESLAALRGHPTLQELELRTSRLARGDRKATREVLASLPALKLLLLDDRVWTLDGLEPQCTKSVSDCLLVSDESQSNLPEWFE